MKKLWICLMTVLTLVGMTVLPAFAATEAVEPVEVTETVEPSTQAPEGVTEQESMWRELLAYMEENGVSTDSFGEDTVDKLIRLGEEFSAMKEQGYSFEERMAQLITPENLLTTASALVLVLSTVALFVMKSRQRAATVRTAKSMEVLKEAYDTEAEKAEALREEVSALREEQVAIHALLQRLSEESALGQKALLSAKSCSLGVANMVKDVFLNSKSLDHAGKDLMIRNYLAATADKEGVEAEKGGETAV